MSTSNRRFVAQLQRDSERSNVKKHGKLYNKSVITSRSPKVSEPFGFEKPERLITDDQYKRAKDHIQLNVVKFNIEPGESRYPDGKHLGDSKEKPWKNYFLKRVDPNDRKEDS